MPVRTPKYKNLFCQTLKKQVLSRGFLLYAEKCFTKIYRDLYGEAMLEPIRMAPKTNRNICPWVLLEKRELISRGNQEHWIILFLMHELFR